MTDAASRRVWLMFEDLQIPNARERAMVGLADLATTPLAWRLRPATIPTRPRRILLLRLERIGDLLMTLDAIALVRALAPDAVIDLVVGSWNAELAALVPGVDRVDVLDVPWLARENRGWTWPAMLGHARRWRANRYDLAVNFEPDIRSNILMWMSAARWRVGYHTGGGQAFLTDASAHDPGLHVRANAVRLVRRAFAVPESASPPAPGMRLRVPDEARVQAERLLPPAGTPLVGVHASGGRPSKQWHPNRFASVAAEVAARHGATVVLTGGPDDRPLVNQVAEGLTSVPWVDLCDRASLPALAAVLERLNLLITGDTGPMHLASAVGTPVVALFGPSDPRRYGPAGAPHEVLRIDLPCSPCGLVRLPPVRCRNRVPECLDGISTEAVVEAAERLWALRPSATG